MSFLVTLLLFKQKHKIFNQIKFANRMGRSRFVNKELYTDTVLAKNPEKPINLLQNDLYTKLGWSMKTK